MSSSFSREKAKSLAIQRSPRKINQPKGRVTDFYAENIFDFKTSKSIPEEIRQEMVKNMSDGTPILKDHINLVASAVTEWALSKGATHFCHWFQPLTGLTAEKHDAFLSLTKDGTPIEKLGVSQLIQGEPDASSLPNGGSRSTFEARGYTSWDLSSPMFLTEGVNGKTLCIPTAFVSYNGEALDIKTPLLRSVSKLNKVATKFMNLIGSTNTKKVTVNCGAEQEYFLIDKAFFYGRPDLVMSGRTLFGSLTTRNQQLNDHYFGTVPERVLSFMQELDIELYRLGIPAKTRHNEVAPGQFEIAPIFSDANIATDNNQLIMALISKIADKHSFVALLHEKPFHGVNGSGKHINWSMSDDNGLNLLGPGKEPHQNHRFLSMVAIIIEAVHRHADALRMCISTHGNDHRLGKSEAPPSIISIYLGDTITNIFDSILAGESFRPSDQQTLRHGAEQLADLLMDNSDRNRTSSFAFTGNRFEFRAVGSSQAIGFPLAVINAAVVEVIEEVNETLENELEKGKKVDEILIEVIRKFVSQSKEIIFNGDGYSKEWVHEAERRELPNLETTYDGLKVLTDHKAMKFMVDSGVMSTQELMMRYNVFTERYNQHLEIEFATLVKLVVQHIIPSGMSYKQILADIIDKQKNIGIESTVDIEIYKKLTFAMESAYMNSMALKEEIVNFDTKSPSTTKDIAERLTPLAEEISKTCNELEEMIPDDLWSLPKYFDMLFLR